jgi:hypothetical protein
MRLVDVVPAPASSTKKLVASFCDCAGPTKCDPKTRKKIAFGSKTSVTYASGATEKTKENYIKRHQVNEDWSKINAGSLSRYVLWSKKSIPEGVKEFKKHFHC